MPAVLVIDDDPGTLDGFAWTLRTERYEVATATTGVDGLRLARRCPFDVMLVDLRLPDMSGIDFLKQIRTKEPGSAQVVIITGFGSVPSAVEALKHGAAHYVEKPIIGEALVDIVRAVIEESAQLSREVHVPVGLKAQDDARVARVIAIIGQRYHDSRLTLGVVADEMRCSREHLCRLIKKHTGMTFGRILD